jgi:hypothetical protein
MSGINPPRLAGLGTPPERGFLQKILEYGIYLLVFLFPWQTKLILRQNQLGRGPWEYGMISLYGTDILLAVLLILFFILSWKEKRKIFMEQPHPSPLLSKERGIWIILSGLDLFIFISIFFAPDIILAVYRYVIFLLGVGLFWLIVKVKYDKIKLAIAFFSALIIQGIIAIQQFLTQSTFASKWLGMATHFSGEPGTSVVETRGVDGIAERWLRAYGSLDHPNVLGGLLAFGSIILIFYFIHKKERIFSENASEIDPLRGASAYAKAPVDRQDDKKKKDESDKKFIIYHLSFIILFVSLLFTFSRSAWLVFASGFLVIFIFNLIKKDTLAVKRLSGVMILLAVIFGAIFINYQNLFITRSSAAARLEVKSFSERKMYLDDSFKLIKKNWLFGVGIGNYTKALANSNPKQPWYYLQPVHNVFLLIWVETGIFGLLFFLAFLANLFWRTIKKKNALGLSLLLGLVIIMSLDHYLWSLHFGVLSFWLLAGFAYKEK